MIVSDFTIKDNNSEFTKYLPNKWMEPLTIIARIKGYDGIDDYITELIKDSLEMFTDTRDELGEDFQKYMHNMIKGKDVPNEWTSNNKEEVSNNENASKFVKQVNEEYYHHQDMKHTTAVDDKEKEDLK